jgi:hypothetical protein
MLNPRHWKIACFTLPIATVIGVVVGIAVGSMAASGYVLIVGGTLTAAAIRSYFYLRDEGKLRQ